MATASSYLDQAVTAQRTSRTREITQRSLTAFIEAVRDGRLQEQVEGLRRSAPTLGRESDDYKKLKAKLPSVTPAGYFEPRRKKADLQRHTGLVVLDLDHLTDASAVRDGAAMLSATVAAFVSPSGDGVKALVAVEPVPHDSDTHETAWRQVAAAYTEKLQVEVDPSGKDVSRLCYGSHDAECYIAGDVTPFAWSVPAPEPSAPVKRPAPTIDAPVDDHSIDSEALAYVPPPDDYNSWLSWCRTLKTLGFTADEVEAWAAQGPKYTPGEIHQRWEDLDSETPKPVEEERDKLRGHAHNRGWRKQAHPANPALAAAPGSLAPPWHHPHDPWGPWECTPDATCARMMRHHQGELLLVRLRGEHAYLLPAGEAGSWRPSPDRLHEMLNMTERAWYSAYPRADEDDKANAAEAKRVAGWHFKQATSAARDLTLRSAGMVAKRWDTLGITPKALTVCDERQLDSDLRYLGVDNGVVDLHTGDLLQGAAARKTLVTRSTGVPYRRAATHPHVDKLIAHVEQDLQGYIMEALGYALHGRVNRRWYVIVGEPGGGKSSVLSAVAAALGNTDSGGYCVVLSDGALIRSRYQAGNAHSSHLVGLTEGRVAIVAETPGSGNFDTETLKKITGGDDLRVRDVGEKALPPAPSRATPFVAVNDTVLDRLDLSDKAIVERTKILDWPRLDASQKDDAVMDQIRDMDVASAMLNKLIKAAVKNRRPPGNIRSVEDAVADVRASSLGILGAWFEDNVQVTRNAGDWTPIDTILSAAADDLGGWREDRLDGRTHKEAIVLLRQVVAGLPKRAERRRQGSAIKRGYVGVRVLTAPPPAADPPPKIFQHPTMGAVEVPVAELTNLFDEAGFAQLDLFPNDKAATATLHVVRHDDRMDSHWSPYASIADTRCVTCRRKMEDLKRGDGTSDDGHPAAANGHAPSTATPPITTQLNLAIARLNTELETLVWETSAAAQKKTIQKVGIRTRLQDIREVEPDRVLAGSALDPVALVVTFERTFAQPEFATLPVADWTAYLQALRVEIQALRMKSLSAQKESEQALVPAVLSQWLQPNLLAHGGTA